MQEKYYHQVIIFFLPKEVFFTISNSWLIPFPCKNKCGFYRWVTPLRAIFCESIILDSRGRVSASKLQNVSNVHKFTKAYGSLALVETKVCWVSTQDKGGLSEYSELLSSWPIRAQNLLGGSVLSLAASIWGSSQLIGQSQYWPLLIGSSKRVSTLKKSNSGEIPSNRVSVYKQLKLWNTHSFSHQQSNCLLHFTNFIHVFCGQGHCSLRKSFRE